MEQPAANEKTKNIFISHIHEELKIAKAIKEELELCFGNGIQVYLSETIPFGGDWQKSVKQNLNDADLILILFSPDSIERPWINIEAGYGIISGKEVVTMYCLGLDQDRLHYIYQRLKGITIENATDIERLLKENIATNLLGRPIPGKLKEHVIRWQGTVTRAIKEYLHEQIIKVKLQPQVYFHIFNEFSDRCLDVRDWSKERAAPVIGYAIHGGNNQLWQLARVGDNLFTIISRYSGLCLEAECDEIRQNEYNGSDGQQWDLAQVSNDDYKISPKGQPMYCVTQVQDSDVRVSRIILSQWGHRFDQKWMFKVTATVLPVG